MAILLFSDNGSNSSNGNDDKQMTYSMTMIDW